MTVRRSANAAVIVVFAIVLVVGLALTTSRASAMIKVPENTAGLLSIYTDSYPLHYTDMAPGEEAWVRLDVVLSDAQAGELSLEVRKSGELATMAGGLVVDVAHCDVAWTNVPMTVSNGISPVCETGGTLLFRADDSADYRISSPVWDVDELERDHVDHLLVRLGLPDSTPLASVEGLTADFVFGLFAEGLDDIAVVTPGGATPSGLTPSALALTGFDALYLALVAVGIIGIGIAVRVRRSSDNKPESDEVPA